MVASFANSASASPPYSVKSRGLWYWSTDLTFAVFPLATSTPGGTPATKTVTAGLGLTGDEIRRLTDQLVTAGVMTKPLQPSRALHDGTVVFRGNCYGLRPAIPSPEITLDLYHRFRCPLSAATFKRTAKFKAAVEAAADRVRAASSPKPQQLLDDLVAAYVRLGVYQHRGDRVRRTVTIIVTGRRSYAIRG